MTAWRGTLSLLALLAAVAGANAQDKYTGERGIFVEEVVNPAAPHCVRVSVNKGNRLYEFGDVLEVTVRSSAKGFLYLFYTQADGNTRLVFPNRLTRDNAIAANTDVVVPALGANFRLRIQPPAGKELLKAIVTEQPLDLGKHFAESKDDFLPFPAERCKGILVEKAEQRWAEHQVEITVVEKMGDVRAIAPRRFAVVIGIDEYKSQDIPRLPACKNDAQLMAEVLSKKCGFEVLQVLVNEQATRKNIEDAIRKQLVHATRPGDTVLIYWSGHGGRIADTSGDEEDKYDEFLPVHDTDTADIEHLTASIILDDQLGRWIQELDGREVAVIIDACHSGGQAAGAKTVLLSGVKWDMPVEGDDFLASEVGRVKDIGQKDAAVLASSRARQISYVRPDTKLKLSVMTNFLLEVLLQGDQKVTLTAAHAVVKPKVRAYVQKVHAGMQEPILAGQGGDRFELREPQAP